MFRKLLVVLASMFFATAAFSRTITLEKNNTLVLRGEVNDASIAEVMTQLYRMNKTLPAKAPIYLYLDTPGGSVSAGMTLVNYVRSLDREVKTITANAYSMGFVIVQGLGERLILRDGVLMMHQAATQLQGQVPGQLTNRTNFTVDYISTVEQLVADRLHTSLDDYRTLIHDEFYRVGAFATQENYADKVVSVKCGDTLQNSSVKNIQVFIFSLQVEVADCPLVRTPLAVVPANKKLLLENPQGYWNAIQYLEGQYLTIPPKFVDIKL